MSSVVQKMKTTLDAVGIAEDESGSAKHENGICAVGTAENEYGDTKKENGTRRPPRRRYRVRERKTSKWERTPPVPSKTSLGAQNMKTRYDTLGTAENVSDEHKA
jgi:hypothetical protein